MIGITMSIAMPNHIPCDIFNGLPPISAALKSPLNIRNTSPKRYVSNRNP